MEEREQPVGLHFASLAQQVGRREVGRQGLGVGAGAALEPFQPARHLRHHRAAFAPDDVAALAVHLPHQALPRLQAQVARRARHDLGNLRADLHEPGESRHHGLDLLVGEAEVGHPALLQRHQVAVPVEHPRIGQLGGPPRGAAVLEFIAEETVVELVQRLAADVGQRGPDRLRILEAGESLVGGNRTTTACAREKAAFRISPM